MVRNYLERYVPLLDGTYLSRMGSTIPRMVRNSFCKVRNIRQMVGTSFWMVDNVRGTLRNIENELANRFRMVPSQFV